MNVSLLRTLNFFTFLALASTECAATSYTPPESFSAASPSGGFKADATVGSSRHTIEMRAMPSGDLLWSAEAAGFLDELWLTDAGELLARSHTLTYVFYTAAGKPGPMFNLGPEIPSDERVRFCGDDSMWIHRIYSYLVRGIHVEGSRSWIYFRTYWGRIVTIDRSTGALDRSTALARRIEDTLLKEAKSWIASTPRTLRGSESTLCPYLDDQVLIHLFVIRAHRLKAGEPYIAAAMKELRGDQILHLEYCLNRVYDPKGLAKCLKGRAPMVVVLLLFAILAGIYGFLLRGGSRKGTQVSN